MIKVEFRKASFFWKEETQRTRWNTALEETAQTSVDHLTQWNSQTPGHTGKYLAKMCLLASNFAQVTYFLTKLYMQVDVAMQIILKLTGLRHGQYADFWSKLS